MEEKAVVQSSTRTLFTILFYSEKWQQCLEQQNLFVNFPFATNDTEFDVVALKAIHCCKKVLCLKNEDTTGFLEASDNPSFRSW